MTVAEPGCMDGSSEALTAPFPMQGDAVAGGALADVSLGDAKGRHDVARRAV
jgi:hypothetical protein